MIESLAWKGRRAFLERREDDAVWCVGKALHYLQDECVSTGLLGTKHDDREDAISDHRVSRDAVNSGVRGAEPSAHFMREVLRSIKPNRDPVKALDRAGLFSGALAASVLLEREPDRRILLEWQGTRRRFWTAVLPASVLVAVVAPSGIPSSRRAAHRPGHHPRSPGAYGLSSLLVHEGGDVLVRPMNGRRLRIARPRHGAGIRIDWLRIGNSL